MTDSHARHVTLFSPGLFDRVLHPAVDDRSVATTVPAALSALLARADRHANPLRGFEARLFQQFGIPPIPEQDLPVAAVTRVADMGIVDNDWWIRADPVHLEPQRAGLLLEPLTDLSQDEANQLTAELNEVLRTDGWLLKAPRPQRWYLKPPTAPELTTTPLQRVTGLDIHAFLPQGPDRKTWHTRLNELQILLHTSTVNARREARGAKTANSLWFWGGGSLPNPAECAWDEVVADDAVSQGLARILSIPLVPLPADPDRWRAPDHPRRSLIVLDEATAGTDPENPLSQAENWLQRITQAVHSGSISRFTFISDSGPEFTYLRKHRWYFWRRSQSLADIRNSL